MKKKIRKFLETGMILAVVLAFVIPGASSITKPTLSEETLGISDAEIEWVPVDASGSHTIIGHKIFLHETKELVTLEIHVSGWDPHLLKAVQATVDSAGYSNGVGDTLNPLGWPGSPEDGCFIDNSRPDYVFYGMTAIDAVYTGDLDYMWGATLLFGGKVDDGQTYYLGTLILEVPTNADGTYTIGFLADVTKTFMTDDNGQNILPLILTPALITINQLPNIPTIIGETNGKTGVEYEYTFNAVDPDGDDVKYHIDWDDGNSETTGFNPSGTDVKVKHTWSEDGTYIIKATAEDTKGLVSPEGTLTVTMPRTRAITSPFLSFLQQHLNLFPILKTLLLQRLGLQ